VEAGYADYSLKIAGAFRTRQHLNVPPIDLRRLVEEEQHLLAPLGVGATGNLSGAQKNFGRSTRCAIIGRQWCLVKLVGSWSGRGCSAIESRPIGQSLAARCGWR